MIHIFFSTFDYRNDYWRAVFNSTKSYLAQLPNPASQIIRVTKIVLHPDYDPGTMFYNDVAVLTLKAPVNSSMAKPITSMAGIVTSKSYKQVLALGWGLKLYLHKIQYSSLVPCRIHWSVKTTTGLVCTNVTNGNSICAVSKLGRVGSQQKCTEIDI